MSEAFRCDGCDELYGGQPAIEVKLTSQNTLQYGAVQTIGHAAGVDDVNPASDPVREVKWPFASGDAEFCVNCLADHVIDGILAATEQGRHHRRLKQLEEQ